MDDITKLYPEYAPIAQHIKRAHIQRAVTTAHAIADFVMETWAAISAPPAPSAVIIERRSTPRSDLARRVNRAGA